jgi:predicted Zn-dependent protease with MMP-like domain
VDEDRLTTIGDVMRAVLAELPPGERRALAGVSLIVRDRPDAGDLARGCDPDQLAAYHGTARELHRGGVPVGELCSPVPLPDDRPACGVVTLFVAHLAPLSPERVRVAILHELGHALGWTEEEIRGAGLVLEDRAMGGCDRC